MRVFLLVLDSVGIGAAPDAATYGDAGSNTLGHIAHAVPGLALPMLTSLGLGNIPALLPDGLAMPNLPPVTSPLASFGAMRERSSGKDTTTGHWEIAGLVLDTPLHIFRPTYPSFPTDLVDAFERETGRRILGNKAASGTKIIDELGPEQMRTGDWIAYTSADSVFQLAAHEEVIPLDTLYEGCRIARRLCDPLRVGRVIARPYVGSPGAFRRTENRRDFSLHPHEPTILDRLHTAGIETVTVGKLDDIFANRGIARAIHVENNPDAQAAMLDLARTLPHGFVFANFIDFDMLYGHRRDAAGYARSLQQTDEFLTRFLPELRAGDLLLITADHGNDPTFAGSDHTREYVPLLAHEPGNLGRPLGIRDGFYDIAATVARRFGLPPLPRGVAF